MTARQRLAWLLAGAALALTATASALVAAARGYAHTEEGWT